MDCQSTAEEICCICCEPLSHQAELGRLSCQHTYCLACIQTWCNRCNTCPICRREMQTIEVVSRESILIRRVAARTRSNSQDGFVEMINRRLLSVSMLGSDEEDANSETSEEDSLSFLSDDSLLNSPEDLLPEFSVEDIMPMQSRSRTLNSSPRYTRERHEMAEGSDVKTPESASFVLTPDVVVSNDLAHWDSEEHDALYENGTPYSAQSARTPINENDFLEILEANSSVPRSTAMRPSNISIDGQSNSIYEWKDADCSTDSFSDGSPHFWIIWVCFLACIIAIDITILDSTYRSKIWAPSASLIRSREFRSCFHNTGAFLPHFRLCF